MSDLNPALQLYSQAAVAVDAPAALGFSRLAISTRPGGGARAVTNLPGSSAVVFTQHLNFMNGSAWDLTVDGSQAAKVFTIAAQAQTIIITNISLLVIYSVAPVFNGNSFGAPYQSGILGLGTVTPGPLANGLLLTCQAAGITTQPANVTVNEDMAMPAGGAQFGSIGGPYLLRSRWDVTQTLTGGSGDKLTWTVRDDMTQGRSVTEIRAVATATSPI